MRKVMILTVLLCCADLCFAETNNDANQTGSEQKQPSLREMLSRLKSKREAEVAPKQEQKDTKEAKPTDVSQDSSATLQKRVSLLEKKIAQLEAKVKALQSLPPGGASAGDIIGFTKSKDGKYVLSANGAKIEVDSVGNVFIKANLNMTLEANTNMNIKSVMLRLNNGNRPVAGLGDTVVVPNGAGTINKGSPTVFVP